MDKQRRICERLKLLATVANPIFKICGEEVRLNSNLLSEGSGYVADVVSVGSSVRRRIRVSLPTVKMVEREIELSLIGPDPA